MKFEFEEILSPLVRYCYLSSAVKKVNSNEVKILEIGSFTGVSLFTIAKACFDKEKKAKIYCIDPFDEIFCYRESEKSKLHKVKRVNKSHFYRFTQRKKYVEENFNVEVIHLKNYSYEVLPLFKENMFDLIYIDGDHRYKGCKQDIKFAKKLVKNGGFICGDDLEYTWDELEKFEIDFKQYINKQEYIKEINCHPGVSLAIKEEFKEVSNYNGFWIVKKEGNEFKKVDLQVDSECIFHFPVSKLIESQIIYRAFGKIIKLVDCYIKMKSYIYPNNSVTKKFLKTKNYPNIEIIDIIDKNLKIKNAKNIRNSNIIISSFRFFDKFYEEIDKSNRVFYLHYDDLKLYEIKESNENNN